MNSLIKSNLENLFNDNLNFLNSHDVKEMFDILIKENPKAFNVNLGIITNLFDNDEIKNLKRAKKSSELLSAFSIAKKMDFNDDEIIQQLKEEILSSINQIKNSIKPEKKDVKNQIIFLEYDQKPQAYFCGYGRGNYPILKQPEYFEFNYHEELYAGIGKVDYKKIWEKLTRVNKLLEDFNIYDHVWETDFYQSLLNAVKFKTYILLHEAFDQIGIDSFDGIEIEKPLMIYGNEHDCESINIYTF